MSEKIIIQQLKVENKRLNENDNDNENENEIETFEKNKTVKNSNIKVLIEKPKEIKSPNWLDKKKFKEILTIIDGNKFGHKNKIGDFKYTGVKVLVNNIKDNIICEMDAKKRLNTLNIIKHSEIKHKRVIPGQKELLNLFDDLSDIILTDKTLMSSKDENEKLKEENENENENENEDEDYENKNENENEDEDYKNKNENDETLMSSDKDDDYDYDYENKDENKDETMD